MKMKISSLFICGLITILAALVFSTTNSTETCDANVTIDLMYVLDNTSSMGDYMDMLHSKLPNLLDNLQSFKDACYGVATFNDKPICGYRSPQNYCAKVETPLSNDSSKVKNYLANFRNNYGGGAPPEDFLGALLVVASSSQSNWRPKADNIVRLMFVVTDAEYRTDPAADETCVGSIKNDGDENYDCTNENYPTYQQVSKWIKEKNITVVVFTLKENIDSYNDLLEKMEVTGKVLDINQDAKSVAALIETVKEVTCTTTTTTTKKPTISPIYPIDDGDTTGGDGDSTGGDGDSTGGDSTDGELTPDDDGTQGKKNKGNQATVAYATGGAVVAVAGIGAVAYRYFRPSSTGGGDNSQALEPDYHEDEFEKEQAIYEDEAGFA